MTKNVFVHAGTVDEKPALLCAVHSDCTIDAIKDAVTSEIEHDCTIDILLGTKLLRWRQRRRDANIQLDDELMNRWDRRIGDRSATFELIRLLLERVVDCLRYNVQQPRDPIQISELVQRLHTDNRMYFGNSELRHAITGYRVHGRIVWCQRLVIRVDINNVRRSVGSKKLHIPSFLSVSQG